jgi:hypothetical protein
MLQIGKLSKRGPVGNERFSRFTDDELLTHMTFWCIYRSPLMLGGNLPENRAMELKLFTNDEVLAVNQQGSNPREIVRTDSARVWKSQAPGAKDVYVALFNTGSAAADVSVDFSLLGIKGKAAVRDLWEKKDAGIVKNRYSCRVNAHGAVLVRVSAR